MPLATSDPLVYKEMMKIKNEHNKANPADRYAPADFFVGQ
jgi:hypothetical protein